MVLLMARLAGMAHLVVRITSIGGHNTHPHTSIAVARIPPSKSSCLRSSGLHLSFRADIVSNQRETRKGNPGLWYNPFESWRRHGHPCEETLVKGTSMFSEASDTGDSLDETSGVSSETVINVPDDSGTTRFFYDELREAAAVMRERAGAVKSLLPVAPETVEKEVTVQLQKDANSEKSSETEGESEISNWDAWHGFDKTRSGKLPIESNGPPMVILQPYLAPEKSQEKPKQKLRRLPLTMPHKLRPLGLPRASLRRRFGIASLRKSVPTSQVGDFNTRDLAADIQALTEKAPVSRVLKKCVWRLKKGSLATTVRELGRMQLPERAIQVVLWLQKYPHLWPDHTSLCTVIQVMVETGEIDTAFELQRNLGRGSARAAQALAFALAKAGRLTEAVNVLNYMKQAGWKIDGSVHTNLLQWACRTGGKAIVEGLLKDTNLLELKLNLQDYTTIMDACSKLGLVDRAESVYLQFKSSGLHPDIVIYTAFLAALTRAGKHQEALLLFGEIQEAGFTPDLFGYQVLVETSAKLGNLDMTVKLFQDLRNAGFDPSPEIYDTLIQLHGTLGFISIANELMVEMQSKGFVPSGQTLSCLSTVAAV